MLKKTFKLLGLILIILAIAAGCYYLFFVYNKAPQAVIYKFNGSPVGLEGNLVTLNGLFAADQLPDNLSAVRDFTFSVEEATKFKRKEIRWPSWDELTASGATSGTVHFKDLPQTEGEGSLDDFKKSLATYKGAVYVEAEFASSILDSKNPTASAIFYEIMIGPVPPEEIP